MRLPDGERWKWDKAAKKTYRKVLLTRAEEAIAFLMANDGFVPLSKREFAEKMYAATDSRGWLTNDGEPNRRVVEEVCNLTRDQHTWPEVATALGGYMITYAPQSGGATLIGDLGEMKLDHQLHMLAGDITRQQATKTINRRRVASWDTAARQALRSGDHDLGLVLGQIKNEIEMTGFVSDSLVEEFIKLLVGRGIEMGDDDA